MTEEKLPPFKGEVSNLIGGERDSQRCIVGVQDKGSRLVHFDRVRGVAGLQAGIDFGRLIDLKREDRDGLRRKSLGTDCDAVVAHGQEANGVGARIVRHFPCFHAGRGIFRSHFGVGYYGAGLIGDHSCDGAGDGLSKKGGSTDEEDERTAGQTLNVIHRESLRVGSGRLAASSLAKFDGAQRNRGFMCNVTREQ